ncbi:TPA: hypothetical protein L5648_005974 [Pseudomonas aeruginosa]|nr:hypothetical protein [Pseudomonas aeruginosa]
MLIRHLSHGEDFRLNRCPGSVDHYNRTLMTRGMKGCYVFCTDEETARYFRGRGGS